VRMRLKLKQMLKLSRLEVGQAFFNKRAWWVYLLALFPTAIFLVQAFVIRYEHNFFARRGFVAPALIDSVGEGATEEQVRARLGSPAREFHRRQRGREPVEISSLQYSDGSRVVNFTFRNGEFERRFARQIASLERSRQAFALMFQSYYLRLAVFFGCLGIFMNLFRGKMLDLTLHLWLLVPVDRRVLLGGEYVAGLAAALTIFIGGIVAGLAVMLWPLPAAEVEAFWRTHGLAHVAGYLAATALACLGYGSVFLAASLLVQNPIIPAAVLLLWEGANPFLPELLQKLSVLYYVRALCPEGPQLEPDAPPIFRLLFTPAVPSRTEAVVGLLAVTALVLWLGARVVRRLQINYSTD